MTAHLASASKRLELFWVWEIWAELLTVGHRAAISAGGTWVRPTASLATWKASSSVQGIYRGLVAGDKSVTGGTTPAPLPSLPSQRVSTAPRPVNQPSSPFCGLHSSLGPRLQPQTLLASCFLYASCPSLSVCRAVRWTPADALLGSSCCHQRGWYPPPRRASQAIPLKDAVLKNPGWVWLWGKDKSFLCCRCCFAVVFLHSRSSCFY